MLGIFIDIETSGLDPWKHRVLEFACRVWDLRSDRELASYQALVRHDEKVWQKADPSSLEVNGFSPEMTEAGLDEATVGEEFSQLLNTIGVKRGEAVFICQNPSFDRAFFSQLVPVYKQEDFQWPYHWLDFASMFWSTHLRGELVHPDQDPWPVPLSKDKIANVLGLPPEAQPHRAMNGVDHLILCYRSLFATRVENPK